jgi:hypothetical protein
MGLREFAVPPGKEYVVDSERGNIWRIRRKPMKDIVVYKGEVRKNTANLQNNLFWGAAVKSETTRGHCTCPDGLVYVVAAIDGICHNMACAGGRFSGEPDGTDTSVCENGLSYDDRYGPLSVDETDLSSSVMLCSCPSN